MDKTNPLKILLLEDSASDAELIYVFLLGSGFQFKMDRVESEKKYVDSISTIKYDLIISDYNLSGFFAPNALAYSLKICPDIPFICVSGAIGEDTAVELLKCGAMDYVSKDRLQRLPLVIERAIDLATEKKTRQKAEDELKKSEFQQATLISNLPGFVYRCANDPKWSMSYISDGCKSITGYTRADFLNNNKLAYSDIIHPAHKEIVWQTWQDVLKDKKVYKGEYIILTANGENRWVWEQGLGIYSANGELLHIQGFITDITDRKRSEQALAASETNLRELNATKDKFFSIIAHDLKSPFSSIIGFSDVLIEKARAKDYTGIEKYAVIVQEYTSRTMALLLNLLEWSMSQTGRMDFSPAYIELDTLINEVTDLLTVTAGQKSITISKMVPSNIKAFADKLTLSTVLRNIISNAIKFTNPGGNIEISATRKETEFLIAVKDDGIGINKDSVDRLFKINESFSTVGTQNEKGTGLGLILCKDFIEKNRGKIWVESIENSGTTFYFTIPQREIIA